MIHTLDRSLSTIRVRVIKTTGNIGIYCPRVFRVRSGPNQSYYTEYDWEHLSPYSTRKVKGRTLESEYFKGIKNKDPDSFETEQPQN